MGKEKQEEFDGDESCSWEIVDVLSERLNLNHKAVANTVQLLVDDNTVPFIARYRKEQTMNMSVEEIREVKDGYEDLVNVQNKSFSVIKTVEKLGKMNEGLKIALKSAKDLKEIDYLYAPYKTGSKRSLAERAREIGLEPLAQKILKSNQPANLQSAVKPGKEGLTSLAEVEKGVQHIIADVIAKDKDILDRVRGLCDHSYVVLKSTKSRATTKKEKEAESGHASKSNDNVNKFELYFDFSAAVKNIKPHQILAINRGENLKILSVKIVIPDKVKANFHRICLQKWSYASRNNEKLFTTSVDDAYSRLLMPLMERHFRADLTKEAEKSSVEVFSSNLKRLLLTPPVRGRVVLGVDPGFANGCKYAVTDISGRILETGLFFVHKKFASAKHEADKICRIVKNHSCETIAIGNGTACRETETMIADLIKRVMFKPLDVKYCIINERGASIYSASDVAQKEMPDLDVTLRSAVSIARRLQDPMAELVKMDPKHIGIGMYQHDIRETLLKSALDGMVEECVSFVGVDVNVASEMLLRRVAGLNATRAKKIIEWREANGSFSCRAQLQSVKGLGPKSYEQCAGFIRVLPETGAPKTKNEPEPEDEVGTSGKGRKRKAQGTGKATASKRKKKDISSEPNNLDMTCIHPESYHLADSLIEMAGEDKENVGSNSFIKVIKNFSSKKGIEQLSKVMDAGTPTVQLIIDGLSQPLGHDIRENFEKPLFKQNITSMEDLKRGTVLTGCVTNTTHFGAFVDIGVGKDALLHNSKMPRHLLGGRQGLELGDRVEVSVDTLDLSRSRIGLALLKLF